jgi:ribosomal protein S8E
MGAKKEKWLSQVVMGIVVESTAVSYETNQTQVLETEARKELCRKNLQKKGAKIKVTGTRA